MEFETPAFVVDGDSLFKRADTLKKGFAECEFSYSLKTLPIAEGIALVREAGWLIEVVSRQEYDFARSCGVGLSSIILNGPSKDDRLLHSALAGGAIVHADSEEELHRAALIGATFSGRLGVRLGLGVADDRWARFGIDVSDEPAAVRLVAEACGGYSIGGVHVHSGVNRASVQEFTLVAARSVAFARAYAQYVDAEIHWVDLGGGFADPTTLPARVTSWDPPPLQEFIRGAMSVLGDWKGRLPVLIFEPGRAVVGDCVDLYTTVETVKTVAGVQVVTVDAGINSLPFARIFSYPIEAVHHHADSQAQTVVCGPLCMSEDVLRDDAVLPKLQKGALLRVRGVGAYNLSMSFDFIRPRAKVFVRHGARLARAKQLFIDSSNGHPDDA